MAAKKMDEDRLEKARVLLARNLEEGHALGFLTFEDIVRHVNVKSYLPNGLMKLAKLVGFGKIAGVIYDDMEDRSDKRNVVNIWEKALLGEAPFYEELFKHVPPEKLPGMFQRLILDERIVTWDNLVIAFPKPLLSACVAEGLKRAEILEDVPEAEVVEEVVDEVDADSGDPYDGKKDITSP
jgi:hypothetical protein